MINPPTKILILGDSPDSGTGLARIGHDLARLLSSMPEFDVAYLGRGGMNHREYPWQQYNFPASDQWGEDWLQPVWCDFAGHQLAPGILLTIWDASRLLWLADPVGMPNEKWLRENKLEKWGYFMQDCEGVKPGKLPEIHGAVMSTYKRVLIASKWGYEMTKRTLPQHQDVDWLPHGINLDTFKPEKFGTNDKQFYRECQWPQSAGKTLWGCVMTNQARKHWPTVFEALSLDSNAYLWAHTDQSIAYWNLPALIYEYGVTDRVFLDVERKSDAKMAYFYNLCDITLLISGGEGFGYPVAESLACGVPVVTGDYGAAAELALTQYGPTLHPANYFIDTQHNVIRALYAADRVESAANGWKDVILTPTVDHLSWMKIGIEWKKWFRKGLTA